MTGRYWPTSTTATAAVFTTAGPVSYTHLDVYKRQVVGPGQPEAWGVFGAMLLREDAGGYVLVGVVSFAAAAAFTALCFRLRNRENRRKDGANKHARHEQEEKSQ